MDERVDVLGTAVDPLTAREAIDRISGWIDAGQRARGIAVNAHKLALRRESEAVRDELRTAELVFVDGVVVQLAAAARGVRLDRVPGVELAAALLARGDARGWSVALLGGAPGVVDALSGPNRWTHHGFYEDEPAVVAEIRHFDPDVLLVGLGSPGQERFLRDHAGCGARFALGVGGSFDVLAGASPRSPAWTRRVGLEGAWRIAQDPRRRWRRLLDLGRLS